MYNEDEDPFRDKGDNNYDDPYKNNMFDNDFYEYSNSRFIYEFTQFDPSDPLYQTVNDQFEGDHMNNGKKDNDFNVGINNLFPYNQEMDQGKKSYTEVNKEDLSTGAATKPKFKEGTIFEISKNFDKKILVGRKKLHNLNGKHDKFAYDNVTRKVKTKLFDSILVVMNASTEEIVVEFPKKNSKKQKTVKPFFVKIDQKIIKETKVEDNQQLFKNKLKEIFSNDVSKKYENLGLDYNRNLIQKIYEENIQKKTIKILERTFLDCLKHFRGSEYYEELAGLEKEYKNVINELRNKGETDEYIEIFEELVGRFEEYYENKKARPKKVNEE